MSLEKIKKYGLNVGWLLIDKVLSLFAGLFVGLWVARYLGPEEFGVLSYITSFVGLLIPLYKLGLDGIVSRNIAINNSNTAELLSNVLALKTIGSFLILSITYFYLLYFRGSEYFANIGFFLAITYLFKGSESIEFYYRAKVRSKFITLANSSGVFSSALYRVGLIYIGASTLYFSMANALSALISLFIIMFFFMAKENTHLAFRYLSFEYCKKLLGESWPMILGSFFALIYLNIDQVMIAEMLGEREVGIYAAAARLSSAWYFIPLTIGWGVQTALINGKKKSEELYYKYLLMLFVFLAILAYLVVLPVSLLSTNVMVLLLGDSYFESGKILSLHIWASIFVFVGSIRSVWVVIESQFKFALLSNVAAGLINVVLNYIWLPVWGIQGAAWATLISYSVTYVLSGLFYSKAFKIAVLQIQALLIVPGIFTLVRMKDVR